jgi:GNAT superfamily N-acetyltransferase
VPAYSGDKAKGFWQEALAALHEQYPDKPILVTEFGYCSIEGTFENAFGEDVMAEMLPNEFAGMDALYVCGATIWCWADHAWPAGAFVNGLAISPFGVVSRERRRGPAYEAVQAMFHERHGRPVPASEERDDSLFMIRETLDDIPIVPFPEGFQVRTLRPAEGHLWTDIVRESETLFDVHDGLFAQQFGDNVEATTWRCFVVENAEGGSVATATAWYHPDFHGERWGRLHWVAVRRPYQKRGIGRALISYALRRMAEWHDRCFLDTQIPRTPALKLYLDFGFLPDLEQPGAVDRWRKVLEALDHHVLRDVIP